MFFKCVSTCPYSLEGGDRILYTVLTNAQADSTVGILFSILFFWLCFNYFVWVPAHSECNIGEYLNAVFLERVLVFIVTGT